MSEVKVNKITPRTNCGTTTLGDSGDTINIPAGVTISNNGTATGFGATGAASWNTTVKTGDFTAVSGEGYFVDTNGGPVTVTLPAGSAGSVVAVKDYRNTFDTSSCTISADGTDKIGGATNDAILSTEGIAVTLVYIDSTRGWLVTDDGLQSSADTNPYIVATGGCITTCGNDKIHTFNSPGTFCVSKAAGCSVNNIVSYLLVGGGGGGGGDYGAGAGAGGFRELKSPSTPYTASPLDGYPNAPNRVTVAVQAYPIDVGGGGNKGTRDTSGTSGNNTTFSTIIAAGGGRGGMQVPGCAPSYDGAPGGSGGGAAYDYGCGTTTVGTGNTPPTTPPQGNNGGSGFPSGTGGHGGGGGGGAGAVGATVPGGDSGASGAGGNGVTSCITGSPVARGGGGGGAGGGGTHGQCYTPGPGGTGGGGAGAANSGSGVGGNGVDNTGGGGGGGNLWTPTSCGGNGGSGVVIIRYRYQ